MLGMRLRQLDCVLPVEQFDDPRLLRVHHRDSARRQLVLRQLTPRWRFLIVPMPRDVIAWLVIQLHIGCVAQGAVVTDELLRLLRLQHGHLALFRQCFAQLPHRRLLALEALRVHARQRVRLPALVAQFLRQVGILLRRLLRKMWAHRARPRRRPQLRVIQ